jgi:hypothetical protein
MNCRNWATFGKTILWRAYVLGLGVYFWTLMSPLVLAAKKKAAVQEVDQGKSYTLPYIYVIALLSLGLMAVLRPGARTEKGDAMHKKSDDE